MTEVLTVVLGSLLGGGLISAVAAIIAARSTARKTDMERVVTLVNELQEDNTRLRNDLRQVEEHYRQKCTEYEQVIGALRAEVARLQDVMRTCGINPDAKPACKVGL